MKRLISILLVLVLLCCGSAPLCFAFEEAPLSAADFAQQAASLCREYDGVQKSTVKKSAQKSSTVQGASEFSLCRLIVSAACSVPDEGAVSVISGYRNLTVLQYNSEEKTRQAYEYYAASPYVEWVEPDKPVTQCSVTECQDTERGTLSWGSETIGAYEVLQYLEENETALSTVSVGIIDSGLDLNHPLFEGRLVDNGVNLSTTGDDTGMSDDSESHGTHVAGIVADNTPDAVRIKPYKIFDKYGNSTELIVASALDMAAEDGMDVVNLSLTADNVNVLAQSIENACQSGVTIVCATGNESKRITNVLPACSPYAVAVGSVGKTGKVSSFSNYGSCVDVTAPGETIYSAVDGGEYDYKSGTSMATAYAAAAAAVLLAADNTLTPEGVRNRLVTYAACAAEGVPNRDKYGAGTVNIAEAYNGPRLEPLNPDKSEGTYVGACTVTFEVSGGKSLYYTTDGSLPTLSSAQYTEPLTFMEDTVLRWFVRDNSNKFRSASAMLRYTIEESATENGFEVDKDGVLLSYSGTDTAVIIPKTVGGITVRAVGSRAFEGQKIEEIYLPESVTTIGDYAFFQCTDMKNISMCGVTYIGKGAFSGCSALSDLDVSSVAVVEENAFDSCGVKEFNFTELESCRAVFPAGSTVYLPKNVSVMPESSLPDCLYYGYSDSYAAQWAEAKGAAFIAQDIPVSLIHDVPELWEEGDAPLSVECYGTGLTYQWYGCRTQEKKDTIIFEGATAASFNPADYTPCCYYYCVITAAGEVPNTAESSLCYRFVAADYTVLDRIKATIPADLSIYTDKTVAPVQEILNSIDYDLDAAHQEDVEETARQLNETVKCLRRKFFLVIWFQKLMEAIVSLFKFGLFS